MPCIGNELREGLRHLKMDSCGLVVVKTKRSPSVQITKAMVNRVFVTFDVLLIRCDDGIEAIRFKDIKSINRTANL